MKFIKKLFKKHKKEKPKSFLFTAGNGESIMKHDKTE